MCFTNLGEVGSLINQDFYLDLGAKFQCEIFGSVENSIWQNHKSLQREANN